MSISSNANQMYRNVLILFFIFILPTMLPLCFSDSQYSVYGSDDISDKDLFDPVGSGLTLLGTVITMATFNGQFSYYIIYVTDLNICRLDAIQLSDGTYSGPMIAWRNIAGYFYSCVGPPNGECILLRHTRSGYKTSYCVINPPAGTPNIKVYTAGSCRTYPCRACLS